MSKSRSSSPSSGTAHVSASANSGSSQNTMYGDYAGPGSGMIPFPQGAPMLFFPPNTRGSFQLGNWPSSVSSDQSALGALSHRTSVDEISHFPSLSSDTETHSQSGSFSGPSGAMPPHHSSSTISHSPFIGLPMFSDARSGMSFVSPSNEGAGTREAPSGPGHAFLNSNHHHSAHGTDGEGDHIGGETNKLTPRSSWMFSSPPSQSPRTDSSNVDPMLAHYLPHPSSHQQPPGMHASPSSFAPQPHHPHSHLQFPVYYPLELRPGGGSFSSSSVRSDPMEEHDDLTSEATQYHTARSDEFEEMDDDSEEDDLFDDSLASDTSQRRSNRRSVGQNRSRTPSSMSARAVSTVPILPLGSMSSLNASHIERHRGSGRKKIDIKPLPTKLKRQITFSKRKTGLLKKVRELTTLTQTEALVILISETGNPHSYVTKKFQEIIRNSDTKALNNFLDAEEKRVKSSKHH